MQRGAFRRGDDVGRGAGACRFGDFHLVTRARRLANALERGQRFRKGALLEIAAGDRDA